MWFTCFKCFRIDFRKFMPTISANILWLPVKTAPSLHVFLKQSAYDITIEFLIHAPFKLTELCLSFYCLAFFHFIRYNVSYFLYILFNILSHVGDLLHTSLIGTFLIKNPYQPSVQMKHSQQWKQATLLSRFTVYPHALPITCSSHEKKEL